MNDLQIDELKNGYKIFQNPQGFMYGIDAVLLAEFALDAIKKGDKIFDLGTGTGIIPLLLEKVSSASHISALEIQSDYVKMASDTMEMNGLGDKISVYEGDIKKLATDKRFGKHSFNVVTSNPPYTLCNHGKKNINEPKTIARHEILCNLEDVIAGADYLLQTNGRFLMIHRPTRLAEIFYLLKKYQLEPKRMCLVQPSVNGEANLVLVEARKNGKPQLNIMKNLIVYDENNQYTDDVIKIYERLILV